MGTSLFLLAVGLVLAVLHALGGLMLTPFLGGTPRVWALVLASWPAGLAAGMLAGTALRPKGHEPAVRRAGLLAAAGATVLACVPLLLPGVCRAILDAGPDAVYAKSACVLAAIVLPAALLASPIPSAIRGAGGPSGKSLSARVLATPGGPLILLALGGFGGALLAAPALADPVTLRPGYVFAALGGVFALCSPTGRLLRVLSLGACGLAAVAAFLLPLEGSRYAYLKAMREEAQAGLGTYYLETSSLRVLEGTEVLRAYDELTARLHATDSGQVAAVAVLETLSALGRFSLDGPGIVSALERHLPPDLAPPLTAFFRRIALVRADGAGRFDLIVHREPGEDTVSVTLPLDAGPLTLELLGDVELRLTATREADKTRTAIDVYPRKVIPARGLFESSDTFETPVRVEDVVLFVDAFLHGFAVTTFADRVEISVTGQAAVGAPKEAILHTVELRSASPAPEK